MPLDANSREPLQLAAETGGNHHPCSRMAGWIVVHSYPQAERWADTNIRRRGYQTYLPLCIVRRRDRVVRTLFHNVTAPLFPGYLFVRFPGNWTPIRYCPGVYRIISAAGQPNIAPEAQISALQATDAIRTTAAPENAPWAPGMPCRLSNGPFRQHPAVVLSVSPKSVLVSVLMFGALREIAVPHNALVQRDE